jgi:signal transduction histidine kinase
MRPGKKSRVWPVAAALAVQSGILALAGVLLAKRKQSGSSDQQQARRVIRAAEDERGRIARELHDDIGQRLSLISMQLSSLRRIRSAVAEDFETDLADAQRELDQVIADVHGLSHTLHSATVHHLGLEQAVRELCSTIERRHPLKIELRPESLPDDLDPDVALCFYRVAQEALNNVIRHSESAEAEVRLLCEGDWLKMRIADSGLGFDAAATPVGLGLGTMEERASAIGGRVSVASRIGHGTTVSVDAPLRRTSAQVTEQLTI